MFEISLSTTLWYLGRVCRIEEISSLNIFLSHCRYLKNMFFVSARNFRRFPNHPNHQRLSDQIRLSPKRSKLHSLFCKLEIVTFFSFAYGNFWCRNLNSIPLFAEFAFGLGFVLGGRRNMATGRSRGEVGGVEGQMDGKEAKANNFALLYTCIGKRDVHKEVLMAPPFSSFTMKR